MAGMRKEKENKTLRESWMKPEKGEQVNLTTSVELSHYCS